MPSKNSLKIYVENGIYHIYNRGVDKRTIFCCKDDYDHFVWLLKMHLEDKSLNKRLKTNYKNFFSEIELLCYCLMPNHFHLLIKQKSAKNIAKFMHCLSSKYAAYYNNRYDRSGVLFQGRYKALLLDQTSGVLHVSRYIHLNPESIQEDPFHYNYSSLQEYSGSRAASWLNTSLLIEYLGLKENGKVNSAEAYKAFVDCFAQYK